MPPVAFNFFLASNADILWARHALLLVGEEWTAGRFPKTSALEPNVFLLLDVVHLVLRAHVPRIPLWGKGGGGDEIVVSTLQPYYY